MDEMRKDNSVLFLNRKKPSHSKKRCWEQKNQPLKLLTIWNPLGLFALLQRIKMKRIERDTRKVLHIYCSFRTPRTRKRKRTLHPIFLEWHLTGSRKFQRPRCTYLPTYLLVAYQHYQTNRMGKKDSICGPVRCHRRGRSKKIYLPFWWEETSC